MEHFFSSIQPNLKRYLMRRSCLLSFPGFFLLLYMGIFLSAPSLEKWGFWGFVFGIGFIGWGMIPYKRISQLEITPHQLILGKHELFFLHSKGREKAFPIDQIKTFSFVQTKGFYGIRLHLINGQNFLLPYFTMQTFRSLSI